MEYRIEGPGRRLINARIEVIGSSVILHSRGGATGNQPPRNQGYAEALIAICLRAQAEGHLEQVLLDSGPARLHLEADRLLIGKDEIETLSAEELAKAIRTRMRRFGQARGVSGGNSTKKIRFDFNLRHSSVIQSLLLRRIDRNSTGAHSTARRSESIGVSEATQPTLAPAALDGFSQTLVGMPDGEFSTADFVSEYRAAYPSEWRGIEEQHGVGGKGAGQHRTVFTYVARRLSSLAKQGDLHKLDYRPAPDWWGNGVVQYWSQTTPAGSGTGERKTVDPEYREGSLRLKTHLRRERHWGLAKKKKADFVAKHGKLTCERCEMDPGELFGLPVGNAVIEVHHAGVAVAAMNENHRTKLSDLQCLCANCHRLVHAEMNLATKL